MAHIAVRYHVASYADWRQALDQWRAGGPHSGVTGVQVLRGVHDPDEIVVVLEGATVERLRAAWDSGEFRAWRHTAGVQAEVLYLPTP